ncbi:MAG: tRNA 2-thiouridine(34) synthase MnmA [Myxococcota bacterium]|nr:tRNA 2-thiouridine(34) synthase MnmA [Myxococcota bacterium]
MSAVDNQSSPKARQVVAMSGGVDSSVAAALLVEAGHEVVGVTLNLAGDSSRCCSLDDVEDARRVAEGLGIRFFVANYTERFNKEVVADFADSYLKGRTPIPCVACNKRFKFDYLMERASAFDAEHVATGHYARITTDPVTGAKALRRPRDLRKDQTYFLFQLDQDQLSRISFPLGELTKAEVRARAAQLGLASANKAESQEICFVPDGDYASVVERVRPEAQRLRGRFVDVEGKVLGEHRGVHRFTVGQRHGLGLSANKKLYVLKIRADKQEVVVGDESGLNTPTAWAESTHWISGEVPSSPVRAQVQVRYRHTGSPATLIPEDGQRVRIEFDEPVRAVAPGQAAVFYDLETEDDPQGQITLGGGWLASGAAL